MRIRAIGLAGGVGYNTTMSRAGLHTGATGDGQHVRPRGHQRGGTPRGDLATWCVPAAWFGVMATKRRRVAGPDVQFSANMGLTTMTQRSKDRVYEYWLNRGVSSAGAAALAEAAYSDNAWYAALKKSLGVGHVVRVGFVAQIDAWGSAAADGNENG